MFKKIIFTLVILSIVAAGGFLAWKNQESLKKMFTIKEETKTSVDTGSFSELKVGVAAMITPSEGKRYYEDLAGWLAKKTNKELKLVFKKSYQEMNDAIENKEVDVAFICAGPYVTGREKFGLELLAAPVVNGKTTYNSYIIVNANSPISKFSDLKGKTFAFTDEQSNTGKLVPTYMVAKLGKTPETFFSKFIYTGSHDASINAVVNNIVDGAAVDSLIYDYIKKRKPGLISSTKIIEISPPFGIPMMVVNPKLNDELKSTLRGLMLSAHLDPGIKEILTNMGIEKFTFINDSDYNSIRQMINFIKEGK